MGDVDGQCRRRHARLGSLRSPIWLRWCDTRCTLQLRPLRRHVGHRRRPFYPKGFSWTKPRLKLRRTTGRVIKARRRRLQFWATRPRKADIAPRRGEHAGTPERPKVTRNGPVNRAFSATTTSLLNFKDASPPSKNCVIAGEIHSQAALQPPHARIGWAKRLFLLNGRANIDWARAMNCFAIGGSPC